ncbi:hypothetical protein BC629DRAFT_1471428 [Irpex lacteus]|nr:hypothetical protein BC629DRAFT_1471428 [Irpex lacteus]
MPSLTIDIVRAYLTRLRVLIPEFTGVNGDGENTPGSPVLVMTPEEATRHNASQPILKLSPEILGLIILYLRTIDPFPSPQALEHASSSTPSSDPGFVVIGLGWVYITHVCRQLRYAALGYGELWDELLCTPGCTRWITEWLERSGGFPLALTLKPLASKKRFRTRTTEDQVICKILEKTPENLSRLRSVLVTLTPRTLGLLRPLFTRPAPNLSEIDIDIRGKVGCHYAIPTPWFAAEPLPHLTRLVLRESYIPWSTFNCPNLTHLEVTHKLCLPTQETPIIRESVCSVWKVTDEELAAMNKSTFTPSLDEFERCLRRLPLLETIILRRTLPQLPTPVRLTITDGQAQPSKIPMLRLRKLEISEDNCARCNIFLNMLDMPQLDHLAVDVKQPAGGAAATQYALLVDYLSSYTQKFGPPISALDVNVEALRWEVCVAVRDMDSSDDEHGLGGDGSASIQKKEKAREILRMSSHLNGAGITTEARHLSLLGFLTALHNSHAFSSLDSLSASGAFWISANQGPNGQPQGEQAVYLDPILWSTIFHMCANARVVRAATMAILAILPLLAPDHVNGVLMVQGTRTPIFPRLESLELVFVPGMPWVTEVLFELLTCQRGRTEVQVESRSHRYVLAVKACLDLHAAHYRSSAPLPATSSSSEDDSDESELNLRPLEYLKLEVWYGEKDESLEEYRELLKGAAKEIEVVKVDSEGIPAFPISTRVGN